MIRGTIILSFVDEQDAHWCVWSLADRLVRSGHAVVLGGARLAKASDRVCLPSESLDGVTLTTQPAGDANRDALEPEAVDLELVVLPTGGSAISTGRLTPGHRVLALVEPTLVCLQALDAYHTARNRESTTGPVLGARYLCIEHIAESARVPDANVPSATLTRAFRQAFPDAASPDTGASPAVDPHCLGTLERHEVVSSMPRTPWRSDDLLGRGDGLTREQARLMLGFGRQLTLAASRLLE